MIHQYKLNGYNIVLDVESGCIHTVDDAAYDIIELYETTPPDKIISIITQRHGITEDDVKTNSLQKICFPDRRIFLKNVSLL